MLDIIEVPGAGKYIQVTSLIKEPVNTYLAHRTRPLRRIKLSTSYGSRSDESVTNVLRNLAMKHEACSTLAPI